MVKSFVITKRWNIKIRYLVDLEQVEEEVRVFIRQSVLVLLPVCPAHQVCRGSRRQWCGRACQRASRRGRKTIMKTLIASSGFWNRKPRGPLVARVLQHAGRILMTGRENEMKMTPALWSIGKPPTCGQHVSTGNTFPQLFMDPCSLGAAAKVAELHKYYIISIFLRPLPRVIYHCSAASRISTQLFLLLFASL